MSLLNDEEEILEDQSHIANLKNDMIEKILNIRRKNAYDESLTGWNIEGDSLVFTEEAKMFMSSNVVVATVPGRPTLWLPANSVYNRFKNDLLRPKLYNIYDHMEHIYKQLDNLNISNIGHLDSSIMDYFGSMTDKPIKGLEYVKNISTLTHQRSLEDFNIEEEGLCDMRCCLGRQLPGLQNKNMLYITDIFVIGPATKNIPFYHVTVGNHNIIDYFNENGHRNINGIYIDVNGTYRYLDFAFCAAIEDDLNRNIIYHSPILQRLAQFFNDNPTVYDISIYRHTGNTSAYKQCGPAMIDFISMKTLVNKYIDIKNKITVIW